MRTAKGPGQNLGERQIGVLLEPMKLTLNFESNHKCLQMCLHCVKQIQKDQCLTLGPGYDLEAMPCQSDLKGEYLK